MKNQKGVTLIALVVTIIVLIILAGVAIAALTGENGLIRRARESKKEQIEGEVRDLITLAVFNAKVAAENQATKEAGYKAAENIGATKDVVLDALKEDLTGTRGFTKVAANTGKTAYEIEYTTTAYQQACNQPAADVATKATIKTTIEVTGNSITIGEYTYGQYNP